VKRSGHTLQLYVPTLDSEGRITTQRKAPAGHALFFVDAMRAAYHPELRPLSEFPLISAISNGEDLNSAPDPAMVGLMVQKHIGIALVTTEATRVDVKGGKLGLARLKDGTAYMTVIETAQAKEAGQQALFERLEGIANTNLVLINYEVLAPRVEKLVAEIGEDEFLRCLCPDLIRNKKKQIDSDGIEREYTQLEGAMGSSLMNLDRYWRARFHEPLVHVINVDRQHRTEFFSPVKSAFDFFMQFHSDRFELNPRTLKLDNHRPGELPRVTLRDPESRDQWYQDVSVVLEAFAGTKIRELDELQIIGKVVLKGLALSGRVEIQSGYSGCFDLSASLVRSAGTRLHNQRVKIDARGEVRIDSIA
jgi:hypothetical protein